MAKKSRQTVPRDIIAEIMRMHEGGMDVHAIAAATGKLAIHVGRIVKTELRHRQEAIDEAKALAERTEEKIAADAAEAARKDAMKKMTIQERKVAKQQREVDALKSKSVYRKIATAFTDEDAAYFLEQWQRWEKQLVDMTPAEEDMLEKLLMVDLRLLNIQRSIKSAQEVVTQLREKLNGRELDVEDDLDLQIHSTIMSTNQYELELNKQMTMMVKEYKDIQEKLNTTRQQREQNSRVGAETFLELIAKLHTDEFRKRVGEQNELMKRAVRRKREQFQMGHKYVDGQIDLPLLDGAHIKKIRDAEAKVAGHDEKTLGENIAKREETNGGDEVPSNGG